MLDHHAQQESTIRRADRVAGCLVGLAVGDALGAPLEFLSREQVRKRFPAGLRDMTASRLWRRGEYTDDTQMALLIAESLLARQGLVATDIACRFQHWAKTAKAVGVQTVSVVNMARYTDDPERCSYRYHAANPNSSAGNGALMRCAPIALFYLNSLNELVDHSRTAARVTHYDPRAQSSCVILNTWIRSAILNGNRDGRPDAFAILKANELEVWQKLARIETCKEQDIASSGYTVHTLEAAAWSFLTTDSYEQAVARAANLGDDADTVAAVCGALAGSFYGYSAIPRRWRDDLQDEAQIHEIALALASCGDENSANQAS